MTLLAWEEEQTRGKFTIYMKLQNITSVLDKRLRSGKKDIRKVV